MQTIFGLTKSLRSGARPLRSDLSIEAVFDRAVQFTDTRGPSVDREGDDVVTELEVIRNVSTCADHDVLLAVYGVGRRRCIDASAREERPKYLAAFSVVGPEPAVAFARENE